MNNKKILISGGAGFIGSHLSLKLVSMGYEVTVLDNLSPQVHGDPVDSPLFSSIRKRVHFIEGDVRSPVDWKRALKDQNIVVHLAASTGTGQSMYHIEDYMDVNVRGTAILLDFLAREKHDVRKIVIASSRAIYGEGKYWCEDHCTVYPMHRNPADMDKGDFALKCPSCGNELTSIPTDENAAILPVSIYGVSKWTQESMVMIACKTMGIPAVAFRYQNVYGPGQSLSNPYTGILSVFSTRIRNGNDLEIYEDGKESRDFVYIDDVVSATVMGIEKNEANFCSLNVGSGKSVSVLEVANMLKDVWGTEAAIKITGRYRIGDIRHNTADLEKIRAILGFYPTYSFGKGIKVFVKWVNQHKIYEDKYDQSVAELRRHKLFK